MKKTCRFFPILSLLCLVGFGVSEAEADYRLCNETSYIVDAAIGVQSRGDVTTRGWFQIVPGQCRVVVQGPLDADKYFVNSRVPDFYDYSLTQFETGNRFCVGGGDFLIAGAANCSNPSHRLESFIEVQPKRDGDDFLCMKILCNFGAVDLGVAENEIKRPAPGPEHSNQFFLSILARDRTPGLGDLCGLLIIGDIYHLRVALHSRTH